MHIISQGRVKLVTSTAKGSERIVAILGKNDFFGEAFLAENERYRADAIALSVAKTCPVSRQQFKHLALSAPSFALSFIEIMAAHLFDCRDQLSLSFDPIKARVVQTLVAQAEHFGQDDGSGWVRLSTELKHKEIASIISATRVSVSLTIGDLRDEGLLVGTRGEYRLNVSALNQLFYLDF